MWSITTLHDVLVMKFLRTQMVWRWGVVSSLSGRRRDILRFADGLWTVNVDSFCKETEATGTVQLKCDGTWWRTGEEVNENWRMEWVASTLHTTSDHCVSSITTADAHTSAVSSRLNWRPRRFKWTRPFRRKMKSCFCACAITFQTQSTTQTLRSAWTLAFQSQFVDKIKISCS